MKFNTKRVLNQIKNYSLKGLTQISDILVNKSTLNILKGLYKEGAIQSLIIHPKIIDCFLTSVTINLRILNGSSILKNLKIFNSTNSKVKLKSIDRLAFKQTTVIISTAKGINTPLYLKRIRSGGTLLLSF